MKRYIVIALSLLALLSVQAQTFNYTGLKIKQEKVKKKNVYEWEQFITANYAPGFISNHTMHSFGLTYGRVKLFGFYVNAMIGTGFNYSSAHSTMDASINGIYPFYTGKNSSNHIAFSAGGIVRMVIPLYFYFGIGYGYQSYTKQISSGEWVRIEPRSVNHGMNWDLGLQGNIKGFTVSVGYSVLTNYNYYSLQELKVGLGYTFKVK